MSGIATIYEVPETEEHLALWATVHAAHHRLINAKIYELGGVSLPEYVLDPINPANTGPWEDQHQVLHQLMDAALGIAGFDLTGVDFRNRDALTGWITQNAIEHTLAADLLEIG